MAKIKIIKPPKKKHGRPRKHPIPDPDAPKRKPGRPRKDAGAPPQEPPPPAPPSDPDGPQPPDPDDEFDRPLTDNEQRYVDEYVVDRIRIRAYRRVFPQASYRQARAGSDLLHARPAVRAEIDAALRAQQIRTQIRADTVLKELRRIGESDVIDLFDPETNLLRHPRHIPIDVRRCIASVKVGRARTTRNSSGGTQTTVVDTILEYKLWNKTDALGKLAAYLGLQTEIPPLDVLLNALPRGLADQVREAMLRQAQRPAQQPPQSAPDPPPPPQSPAEEAPSELQ